MNQPTSQPDRATLRLIGRFRLKADDDTVVDLPSRRSRALLAYLALAPERSASRERLCGLLWSDRAEAQARASLRQCLLELRGALSACDLDLLDVSRESIGLQADAVDVDVDALEASLTGDATGLAASLSSIGADRLLDDLEIGGLFEEWRGQARERLDRVIATAVRSRLGALAAEGDWAKTRTLADAFLQRDRLDETVVAAAMRADVALGATGAAHRRYQNLEADLRKELGVAPGAATRAALAVPATAVQAPVPAPTSVQTATAETAERKRLPLPDRPSIAVMPFKNLSGDPEQEYFADAITEDIVSALARWRWFFVIAPESSLNFKNREFDAARIGHELGVRFLLEGSVRKSSGRVRVSARLIDVSDGSHTWTERFDRDLTHVFDLQDEITEQVAAAIEPAMIRGEGLRIARKAPADYGTLDFFYRGMWHLHNMTEQSDVEALSLFEEVVRREPELPMGYVGVSRILYARAVYGTAPDPIELLNDSRRVAETAIGLDPRDAYGYYARSAASIFLHDHDGALADARRAVEINPNFALAHVRLGQVLVFNGQPELAIEPIERGLRLSPFDPQLTVNLNLLALALFQARRYEEAVEQSRSAMNRAGDRSSLMLAASLAMAGRAEESGQALPPFGQRAEPAYRPIAPSYVRGQDLEHIRTAIRLAREAARLAEA